MKVYPGTTTRFKRASGEETWSRTAAGLKFFALTRCFGPAVADRPRGSGNYGVDLAIFLANETGGIRNGKSCFPLAGLDSD